MLRSRKWGMLVPGLLLACALSAAPASAAGAAPSSETLRPGAASPTVTQSAVATSVVTPLTIPLGSCFTEGSGGITSAIGTALFTEESGIASTVVACGTTIVQPLSRWAPTTSPFGMRIHPITGSMSMHYGIDFARWGITGTEIRSISAGTVVARVESFATTGAGNTITIAHDGGIRSQYMHMIQPSSLTVGDRVIAGEVIGYVGSTGGSTGSHLHLEVRLNGTHIDPAAHLAGAPFLK